MEITDAVKNILEVTNNSPYGWLDLDSNEYDKIIKILEDFKKGQSLHIDSVVCSVDCLNYMRKREETIEKVYKEKAHYLDEVETKEDAFREGINAAMQVLNLHLVSKTFTAEQINTAYDVGFCDGCEEARPAY